MSWVYNLYGGLGSELLRVASGRLFTEDEIRRITAGSVGRHLADLFPLPRDEQQAVDRVSAALTHISAASEIILEMQRSLETQSHNLKQLLAEIDDKKTLAERYETLAKIKREQLAALRKEIEESLRQELEAQAAKGRRARVLLWVLTLVAGAALGAYIKDIIGWF
ncbi:MAG: hypothetical protein WC712_01865 [Candidatus Brocadiia bacterium]